MSGSSSTGVADMTSGVARMTDGGPAAVSQLEVRAGEAHSPRTVEGITAPAESVGRNRQRQVYLSGLRGRLPSVPISAAALEERARAVLSEQAYAYVAGSAGLESTARANHAAFERLQIVPRMFRDVSQRDTSVELFGRRLASPFLVAPIGVLELVHRQADLAVARAAAAEGVPMIFSNQASVSMEECAAAMGDAPRWFQLYWSMSDELVASLVGRAEACGCEAVVVTLDTTLFGWRPRDLDLAFLPFAFAQGLAQYTSDPVFRRLVEERRGIGREPVGPVTPEAIRSLVRVARRYPGSFFRNLRSGTPLAAVRLFLEIYSRPSLTWDDLSFLREATKLPIVLKGVLDPEDARMALERGVDGIVVSNHGGRQLDGAIASIDALPTVAQAVDGQVPVLLDSGIRCGADVFKAVALGARAVLLGRPYVYGLALAGENGVRQVLRNFQAELDLTMGLAGCRSVAEVAGARLSRTG
jgi:isopentenyl diphosphate isomerase/L-lactate dehydrogenase-like FMN-dependent dehydrogenase